METVQMDLVKTSADISKLAEALAQAQGEFDDAIANARNPHFDSAYSDMAAVRKAIKAPMAKHGLSIMQHPVTDDNQTWLTTILMHSSGQWVQSTVKLLLEKPSMQGLKSAITYGRRTTGLSILGVAEADDDGNEAEKHPGNEQGKPKAAPKVEAKGKEQPKAAAKPAAAQAPQNLPSDVVTPIGSAKGKKIGDFEPVELNEYLAKTQSWFDANKAELKPFEVTEISTFLEAGKEYLCQQMELESEQNLRDLDKSANG